MRKKTFKDASLIKDKDVLELYLKVKTEIVPILFSGVQQPTMLLGSIFKKPKNASYGDLDVGIYVDGEPEKEDLERVKPLLEANDYETKIQYGLNGLSLKVPFKNNFVQVDLMFGDLEWLKFAYWSPDFTKQESKYKGLYRTMLIQCVVSEVNKDIEMIDGVVSVYEHYTMRLDSGLWKVKKSLVGKKGKIIKTPTITNEEFVSNDPDFVSQKFFGVNSYAVNSFEDVWKIIHSKSWYHKHFKDLVLKRFQERLSRDKYEFPFDLNYIPNNDNNYYMFVGGFKPITGAHFNMIIVDCLNSRRDNAIIFIGPATRDGITQDDSYKIAKELFKNNSFIEIIKCKINPVVEMFQWLEEPDRLRGKYTLVSGNKDKDFNKSEEFFESYKPGGKYRHNLPPQVEVFESPKLQISRYLSGKRKGPISATNAREDVINNDFETFATNYPIIFKTGVVKTIFNILKEKLWVEPQVT